MHWSWARDVNGRDRDVETETTTLPARLLLRPSVSYLVFSCGLIIIIIIT